MSSQDLPLASPRAHQLNLRRLELLHQRLELKAIGGEVGSDVHKMAAEYINRRALPTAEEALKLNDPASASSILEKALESTREDSTLALVWKDEWARLAAVHRLCTKLSTITNDAEASERWKSKATEASRRLGSAPPKSPSSSSPKPEEAEDDGFPDLKINRRKKKNLGEGEGSMTMTRVPSFSRFLSTQSFNSSRPQTSFQEEDFSSLMEENRHLRQQATEALHARETAALILLTKAATAEDIPPEEASKFPTLLNDAAKTGDGHSDFVGTLLAKWKGKEAVKAVEDEDLIYFSVKEGHGRMLTALLEFAASETPQPVQMDAERLGKAAALVPQPERTGILKSLLTFKSLDWSKVDPEIAQRVREACDQDGGVLPSLCASRLGEAGLDSLEQWAGFAGWVSENRMYVDGNPFFGALSQLHQHYMDHVGGKAVLIANIAQDSEAAKQETTVHQLELWDEFCEWVGQESAQLRGSFPAAADQLLAGWGITTPRKAIPSPGASTPPVTITPPNEDPSTEASNPATPPMETPSAKPKPKAKRRRRASAQIIVEEDDPAPAPPKAESPKAESPKAEAPEEGAVPAPPEAEPAPQDPPTETPALPIVDVAVEAPSDITGPPAGEVGEQPGAQSGAEPAEPAEQTAQPVAQPEEAEAPSPAVGEGEPAAAPSQPAAEEPEKAAAE